MSSWGFISTLSSNIGGNVESLTYLTTVQSTEPNHYYYHQSVYTIPSSLNGKLIVLISWCNINGISRHDVGATMTYTGGNINIVNDFGFVTNNCRLRLITIYGLTDATFTYYEDTNSPTTGWLDGYTYLEVLY